MVIVGREILQVLSRRTWLSGVGLAGLAIPAAARPARPETHPVAAAKPPVVASPPSPLPAIPKNLAVEDRGMSLNALCQTFSPLLSAGPRGRFESSAEYDTRIRSLAVAQETPVGVTTLYKLNVGADCFRLTYDADEEKVIVGDREDRTSNLTFLFSIVSYKFINHLAVLNNWIPELEQFQRDTIIESIERRELPRQMNDSGFGPMVEVTPIRGSAVGLAYTQKSRSVAETRHFPLSRVAAQSEFDRMRVLIAGHVLLPVVNEGFLHCSPTEMNTKEIHLKFKQVYMDVSSLTFYSPATGNVFHHMQFEQYA